MSNQEPDEEIEQTLAPGTMLGRYRIGRLLGSGGMGSVYEGTHTDLRKRVAIKTLHPSVAALPGARARFLREGEAASRIRHPNVVDVTDVGTEGAITFLVMEYLEGEDLFSRLTREHSLTASEAADCLLPVIGAIAAAHDEGVIHRDLKPANVFLVRTRHAGVQPMVLDFGISKVSGGGTGQTLALTGVGASLGTPCYISPEQVRGAGVTAFSDQYALGAILYECVTGRRAHDGESVFSILHSVGAGTFPPPRAVRPEISVAFENAILRAMRLEPADRFPTLRGFGRALLPFATEAVRAQCTPLLAEANDAAAPFSGAAAAGGLAGGTLLLPPGASPSPITSRPRGKAGSTTLGQAATAAEPLTPPPRRLGPIAGAVSLVAAAAVGLIFFSSSRSKERSTNGETRNVGGPALPASPAPTPPRRISAPRYFANVTALPDEATMRVDGTVAGAGTLSRGFDADGTEHTLIVSAPGFETARIRFRDQPPPQQIELRPLKAPEPERPNRHSDADRAVASPTTNASGATKKAHSTPGSTKSTKPAARTDRARNPNSAPIID
jgi:hypothetical protein